jgi:hypothetical protein
MPISFKVVAIIVFRLSWLLARSIARLWWGLNCSLGLMQYQLSEIAYLFSFSMPKNTATSNPNLWGLAYLMNRQKGNPQAYASEKSDK